MKKNWILILVAVISTFSFISSCYASVKENPFTDEKCITNDTWKNTAKTDYSLNETTGKYVLAGDSYYDNSSKYIYYGISNDGKELYGYIPNFSKISSNALAKSLIYNSGIITNYDCSGTLMVTKEIVGTVANAEIDSTSSDSGIVRKLAPNTASPLSIAAIIISISLFAVAIYSYLKRMGKLPKLPIRRQL